MGECLLHTTQLFRECFFIFFIGSTFLNYTRAKGNDAFFQPYVQVGIPIVFGLLSFYMVLFIGNSKLFCSLAVPRLGQMHTITS